MRWNTFVRSAAFAAVAAAVWLPWVLVASPIVGGWNARALYLGGLTALYVGGLSMRGARRIAVAVAVGFVAAGLALAVGSAAELAIGLAVILGVVRSGYLYRAAPARAVTTEAALLVAGLLFARFLAGPSLVSTGLAIWGFFLVQSLFFLIGGVHRRAVAGPHSDPFEEAYRRALVLLERAGV